VRQSLLLEAKHAALREAAPQAMVAMRQARRLVLIRAETEWPFGHSCDETPGAPVKTPSPDAFLRGYPACRKAYCDPKPGLGSQGPDLVAHRQNGKQSPPKARPRWLRRRALSCPHPNPWNIDPYEAE